MKKSEFFKICDSADQKYAHQLDVSIYYRDLERMIEINGSSWCHGGLITYTLYKPFPGRQWNHRDQVPRMLEAALSRFKRWLVEWKKLRGILKDERSKTTRGGA